MAIEIYKDTKVYIACPAYVATGGPELLHQLGYHMVNDIGCETYMYYYNYDPEKTVEPVCDDYRKYKVPYIINLQAIEDKSENILIVPEILPALKLLPSFSKIRKGVWFLSVDNYYYFRIKKTDFILQKLINKFFKLFSDFKNSSPFFDLSSERNLKHLQRKYNYKKDKLLRLANFYMTNSYRGLNWFSELKPMYYLSEYLSTEFLRTMFDASLKRNLLAYNPRKGISFTKKILFELKKRDSQLMIIPLENMSRSQVIETLKQAKVYIDFGNHPGKDRLPREAAILGCCVITGKRGSAGNDLDVPIPSNYKFEDKVSNIPKIVDKIIDCIQNYKERVNDFKNYREFIKNEPNQFISDLKKIFSKP